MATINIAKDFSKAPGIDEFTAERFLAEILIPKLVLCIQKSEELTIELDGGYGYPPSFLKKAFGELTEATGNPIMRKIKFVSVEEPVLIDQIRSYIDEGFIKHKGIRGMCKTKLSREERRNLRKNKTYEPCEKCEYTMPLPVGFRGDKMVKGKFSCLVHRGHLYTGCALPKEKSCPYGKRYIHSD